MDTITDANYISDFVGERLMAKGVLHAPVSLQRFLQGGTDDPDSKLVFLNRGRHGFVVTISPLLFPEVVAEECDKAAQMRSRLGGLGAPILVPLDTGRILTSSYAVLPYRRPLSGRRGLSWLDRIWAKRHLLEWLLQVTQQGGAVCGIRRYEAALTALGDTLPAESPTGALLRTAEKHLRSGRFAARAVPMHGDLWKGNVLHGAASTAFTLVDWRGSATDGFPVFDLLRVSQSFGLTTRALLRELQLHRRALGCQMEDLPLYLLGALGHYARHLGEMSLALFRTMANDCVTRLSSALELPSCGSAHLFADGDNRSAIRAPFT